MLTIIICVGKCYVHLKEIKCFYFLFYTFRNIIFFLNRRITHAIQTCVRGDWRRVYGVEGR